MSLSQIGSYYNQAIVKMRKSMPKLNGRYTTFTKAVLSLIDKNKLGDTKRMKLQERKQLAEEEATKFRSLCKHIRREWYKKTKKDCSYRRHCCFTLQDTLPERGHGLLRLFDGSFRNSECPVHRDGSNHLDGLARSFGVYRNGSGPHYQLLSFRTTHKII